MLTFLASRVMRDTILPLILMVLMCAVTALMVTVLYVEVTAR